MAYDLNPYTNEYGYGNFDDSYNNGLPLNQATVSKPVVTPAQIQQVTTKHAQQKDIQSLAPQPDYSTQPDNKYTAFALQLQKAQAENGDALPFTAPTAFSMIEDSLFSALTTYAIGRLLGANANHSWGMGLIAAVKNFDQDQQMKERYPMVANMLKQGYSYPAVMQWYQTGKTDAIEAEGKNLASMNTANANRAEQRYEFDQTQAQNAQNQRNANTIAQANAVSNAAKNGVSLSFTGNGGMTPMESIASQEGGVAGKVYHPVDAEGRTHDVTGQYQVDLNTARQYGFNGTAEQLAEPATNKYYAEKIYSSELAKWGDPVAAAVAYNAGDGAVTSAQNKAKAANDSSNWVDYLPGGPKGSKPANQYSNEYAYAKQFQANTGAGFNASPLQNGYMGTNNFKVQGADTNGDGTLSATEKNNWIYTQQTDPTTGKSATGAQMKAAKDYVTAEDLWNANSSQIDTGMQNVKALIDNPNIVKSAGPIDNLYPNWMVGHDVKSVRGQLSTIQSQEFLNAIKGMKGMGALSDAEGAKLANAIAHIDLSDDPETLRENLNKIYNMYLRFKAAYAYDANKRGFDTGSYQSGSDSVNTSSSSSTPNTSNAVDSLLDKHS